MEMYCDGLFVVRNIIMMIELVFFIKIVQLMNNMVVHDRIRFLKLMLFGQNKIILTVVYFCISVEMMNIIC